MTAPLFHLEPGALDDAAPGSVITLTGAEAHHAHTVMRLGPGESIQLSDTRIRRISGVIRSAEAGVVTVEVSHLSIEPAEQPQLVLVQALAKDKRDLQGIESATELGVDRIIPWEAERSVAQWKPGREAKKHAEWVNTVTAAAKQTRRTSIPQVEPLHRTGEYVQRVEETGAGVVVLHERENRPLRQVLEDLGLIDRQPPLAHAQVAQSQVIRSQVGQNVPGQNRIGQNQAAQNQAGQSQAGQNHAGRPQSADHGLARPLHQLHVVVGPEGGITDREIERFRAVGAHTARLGPTVLRSSTAGPAAVAAVQVLLGRWDRPTR
ncbi:16S rRNA (uracil(1498)-N(3))-methyltransferase [Nesterenkonia alba]|uniref:16S rRNA (uracil(1498)-N(3))-methyltransferase n=1 Tax=Nesterenkonia alba TaxID=515814 RepID=UPI0003B5889B|nr:16S rRNA (uracil(1498)-N(3))-methyltransferase [Nesterenkonia alba]